MRLALVVVALVAGACPSPPTRFGPDLDAKCAQAQAQALVALPIDLSYRADHGGLTCIPGSAQCGSADACSVDVGDVAIGADEVVVVSIRNLTNVSADVSSVTVESTTQDWYVEGEPPNIIPPNATKSVSLVLRPSAVGSCDGNLVVSSDASNRPRGNVALTLHASCVAGAAAGCSISGACCCANGATSGDPICDGTGRVSCGTGFIAFDDACNETPCVP